MAYGHTASGKTHTIFGSNSWLAKLEKARNSNSYYTAIYHFLEAESSSEFGLAQRTLAHLYDDPEIMSINISFFQIYMENVIDLLSNHFGNVAALKSNPNEVEETKIYQTPSEGVVLSGISEYNPQSLPEAIDYIRRGCLQRKVRDNMINKFSSRSHTILRLSLTLKNQPKLVRLNIVDLAGSERYAEEGVMSKLHLQEQRSINQSLSALSKVILQLNNGNYNHIHFRESKLTRILKDALEGRSRVVLLAALAPVQHFGEESLRTLQFAKQCTKLNSRIVTYEPEIVKTSPDKLADYYRKELEYYKSLLQLKKSANVLKVSGAESSMLDRFEPELLAQKVQKLEAEKLEYKSAQRRYHSELQALQLENSQMKQLIKQIKAESPRSSMLMHTSREHSASGDHHSARLNQIRTKAGAIGIHSGFKVFATSKKLGKEASDTYTSEAEVEPATDDISHQDSPATAEHRNTKLKQFFVKNQQTGQGARFPDVDVSFYQNYLKLKARLEALKSERELSPGEDPWSWKLEKRASKVSETVSKGVESPKEYLKEGEHYLSVGKRPVGGVGDFGQLRTSMSNNSMHNAQLARNWGSPVGRHGAGESVGSGLPSIRPIAVRKLPYSFHESGSSGLTKLAKVEPDRHSKLRLNKLRIPSRGGDKERLKQLVGPLERVGDSQSADKLQATLKKYESMLQGRQGLNNLGVWTDWRR